MIIVAGGIGTRMDAAVPKQFMLLAGKPVLMHSLTTFATAFPGIRIVIALPAGHFKTWENLCAAFGPVAEHSIVNGGVTRFHSVKNALEKVDDDSFIAVHDGARPLASTTLLQRAYEEAEKYGNAIPVTRVNESLRMLNGPVNTPVDRNQYRIIQTPQVFRGRLLKQAYQTEYMESFTDDASVVEYSGTVIHLFEGEESNLKITTPSDLELAEFILSRRKTIA